MTGSEKASPAEVAAYNRFIGSLELNEIVLARAEVEARTPSILPGEAAVQAVFDVTDDECESEPNVCQVLAQLKVNIVHVHSKERLGLVDVTFRLIYTSQEPITPAIRQRFKAVNVPMNAWPYLREYVQQTMTRFGWPPFILPPYRPDAQTPPTQENADGATKETASASPKAAAPRKKTTKRKPDQE